MLIAPAWYDNIPLVGVVVAALLYELGGRQRLFLVSEAGVKRARSSRRQWQSLAFYAGLVTIVAALQPPMDGWADSLFWVHMIQHMMLLMLAAPLFIISAPWMRIWSGFPLAFRRPVARSMLQDRWSAPVRAVARFVGGPIAAWLLFNFVLIGWHVPYLYDLAVQNQLVHDLEHFTFLVFGIIFWGQLIDSAPFHSRLDYMRRFFYLAACMFPSWILALIMVFSGTPLYPAYVIKESSPSGLGPLVDQQMAGAVMWMIGSIPFAITGFWLIYMWVSSTQEPDAGRRGRRRVSAAGGGPRGGG